MTTPLEALITGLLTTLGNQTLRLDPLSRDRLERLEGSVVRLDILPPTLATALAPEANPGPPGPITLSVSRSTTDSSLQLMLEPGSGKTPNAIVRGTLPDILAHLRQSTSTGNVTIEGDEAVLSEMASLIQDFEPDLGRPIGELIGQDAAEGLLGVAEAAIAGLRSAAEVLGNAARDSAHEAYVADVEFDTMLERMEALQLTLDRLNARVTLLHDARETPP